MQIRMTALLQVSLRWRERPSWPACLPGECQNLRVEQEELILGGTALDRCRIRKQLHPVRLQLFLDGRQRSLLRHRRSRQVSPLRQYLHLRLRLLHHCLRPWQHRNLRYNLKDRLRNCLFDRHLQYHRLLRKGPLQTSPLALQFLILFRQQYLQSLQRDRHYPLLYLRP